MFSLHHRGSRLCDGVTRRELLRVGGLSALGISLPELLAASANAAPFQANTAAGLNLDNPSDKTFARAKNVIFVWLQGGPPQHETFDPKPEAPAEIRGAFKPIQTNVPGIRFCELLPRTACIADKLAVVRSLSTNDNNHDGSGYWVLTGYKYVGPNSRTIQPTDWPYLGSIVKRLKPSEKLPPLSSVWIPDMMRLNENVTPAGQTGGIMGRQWDPERFVGDPARPDYQVEGLNLSDLPPLRLQQRQTLLGQIERHFAAVQQQPARMYDAYQAQAFDLLISGRARAAFDLSKEPAALRDRYGRRTWGQCLLLARRLVEAGVRLVHVNWPRDPGDQAVDNPLWDTHAQNADRLEDCLCPQFDQGFTALIEDLDRRGMLAETLVVCIGEFGRTPKINNLGGRDHWGPVFSFALAGAGISGGQVFGASDKTGGYAVADRIEPQELTATIFHLLGVPHRSTFHDAEGREHKITLGSPLYKLLGSEPATDQRTRSDGDVARLSAVDESPLLNSRFELDVPLLATDQGPRPKGWRASPLLDAARLGGFGARWEAGKDSRHALLGYGVGGPAPAQLDAAAKIVFAQEIRNPRVGTFTLTARVCGVASSRDYFENVFLKQFTCRLVLYRNVDEKKDPLKGQEQASVPFVPVFQEAGALTFTTHTLTKLLDSAAPGQNFAVGNGLGVAIVVSRSQPTPLAIAAGQAAGLRVAEIRLEYSPRERNDKVQV